MTAHRRLCSCATAAVLALAAVFSVLISPALALPRSDLLVQTASSEFRFDVEIADDASERAEGLMYRETMADNAGMLFLYSAPQPVQFWMKNTPMSLDIVFVRADGTIARIAERTTPFSEDMIPSGEKVSAVLEVKAGMMHQLGVRVGDRLKHPTYFPE
jgi:uncharacterized membrane protein (UPF0127 family)